MDVYGKPFPQEQISDIIKQTLKDVTKLERDITKLESQGTLQLNYNPPGTTSHDRQQFLKDKQNIENTISFLKNDAATKADAIAASFHPDQQNAINKDVRVKLNITDKDNIKDSIQENEMPIQRTNLLNSKFVAKEKDANQQLTSSRFGSSLSFSQLRIQEKQEPANDKGSKFIKQTDKDRD